MVIERLDARDPQVAARIYEILRASYREEAALLGVEDFPPLRRSVEAVRAAPSTFFGLIEEGTLAAVAEVADEGGAVGIHSLVVHPDFFRRGLATHLLQHLFRVAFPGRPFTVSTGAANAPAIRLYEKLGFRIGRCWEHEEGIAMVTLHRLSREEHG